MQVGRSPAGWEIAVCDVELTPAGKDLFGLDSLVSHPPTGIIKGLGLTFLDTKRIQQMHRDIVHAYPPDTIPLGYSPRCEVQGIYIPRRLITLQGHPEFTEDIVSEVVALRGAQGVFSKAQTEDALNRARNPHDGVAVGVAFLRLLLE